MNRKMIKRWTYDSPIYRSTSECPPRLHEWLAQGVEIAGKGGERKRRGTIFNRISEVRISRRLFKSGSISLVPGYYDLSRKESIGSCH